MNEQPLPIRDNGDGTYSAQTPDGQWWPCVPDELVVNESGLMTVAEPWTEYERGRTRSGIIYDTIYRRYSRFMDEQSSVPLVELFAAMKPAPAEDEA